jgi:hemolysin activation/secretion protein
LGATFQPANLLSSEKEFENAALDPKANGRFYIFTTGVTREQNIWRDWGIRFHADGQWANQPLISTEQFSLGGLAGVRGYHEGELYGDRGWKAQIEPHTPYLNVGSIDNKLPVLIRAYTFLDVGQRFLIADGISLAPAPFPQEKTTTLMGTGFGFSGTAGEHMDFRVQVGFALLDTPRQAPVGARSVSAGDSHIAFAFGINF